MLKRFHEAPIGIFSNVQSVTDGDYALVHLLEDNEDYAELFMQARKAGREIILDNSVYELGESVSGDLLVKWINLLEPTWYIVPDAFNDSGRTISMFQEFINTYPDLPGKRIGVVQGSTYEECVECYKALEPHCDMLAFSFGLSMYDSGLFILNILNHAAGRACLIKRMMCEGVINKNKPHHLLGISTPSELQMDIYKEPFIYSVDTSNPVMYAIEFGRYPDPIHLVLDKPSGKLCDNVDIKVTNELRETIMRNIYKFREIM